MSGDTRERILEVSTELFVDQGYDGTSLREIAARLGVTKAALYYHFASKDQILQALLAPGSAMIAELLARLEAARGSEQWADALAWVVQQFFTNLTFFRLIARNHVMVEEFTHAAHHEEMHERVEKAAAAASSGLAEQVRMVCALGSVTGFDDWAPTLLQEAPPEALRAELVASIRRILDLPARVADESEPAVRV